LAVCVNTARSRHKEITFHAILAFVWHWKSDQISAQGKWFPGTASFYPYRGELQRQCGSLWGYQILFSAGNRNLVTWSVTSHRHRHEFHYSRILKCCTRLFTTSNSQTVRAKCDIMWLRVTAKQSSSTISPSSIKNKQINTVQWHLLSPTYDKAPT
jgi:hypothetical protein